MAPQMSPAGGGRVSTPGEKYGMSLQAEAGHGGRLTRVSNDLAGAQRIIHSKSWYRRQPGVERLPVVTVAGRRQWLLLPGTSLRVSTRHWHQSAGMPVTLAVTQPGNRGCWGLITTSLSIMMANLNAAFAVPLGQPPGRAAGPAALRGPAAQAGLSCGYQCRNGSTNSDSESGLVRPMRDRQTAMQSASGRLSKPGAAPVSESPAHEQLIKRN